MYENKFIGDMQEVAELCGNDIAYNLQQLRSGLYCYIPKEYSGWIEAMPIEDAKILMEYFGGDRIYISKSNNHNASKEKDVVLLKEHQLTNSEIALKLGITDRRVRQILQRYKERGGAISLACKKDDVNYITKSL